MGAWLAVASVAFTLSLLAWLQTRPGARLHENVVVASAWAACCIGVTGSVLVALGTLGPWIVVAALWLGTLVTLSFTRRANWRLAVSPAWSWRWLEIAVIAVVAAALRAPPMYTPLAGRDQGTYTLRAEFLAQRGRADLVDPVLARAGASRNQRSGPLDVLGLYGKAREPERVAAYEGPYRPGWYLAERNAGRVVPQFFHMHPVLLALGHRMFGSGAAGWVGLLQGVLTVVAVWCLGRRFWPKGPFAPLAATIVATSPLAIWVHRTALSETTAGLFLIVSALLLARGREDGWAVPLSTMLLGALAWLRGDGWLIAPAILAATWMIGVGAPHRRRAGWIYAVLLLGSVVLHVSTTYPYVHDEVARISARAARLNRTALISVALAGVSLWWSVDVLSSPHVERWRGAIARAAPLAIAIVLLAIVASYVASLEQPRPPWSRLDAALPMLGWPLLIAAFLGVVPSLRRWRVGTDPVSAAWLGLVGAVVIMLAVYARRAIPQLSLFYYGRYLVPFVLPAAALLATATVHALHQRLAVRGRRVRAALLAGLLGCGIAGSVAAPLVVHPEVRLAEFDGTEQLLHAIERRLPEEAIVIAGGEGWHHGHTFNQVGGALAMRGSATVLPYRTREQAYATAYELLIGQPEASGDAAPPVFLLLNEATHRYRPSDATPSVPIAAIDDRLPPPLRARSVALFELFSDRLTPTIDGVPTRVTRDQLRMALVQLDVDPARTGEHRVIEGAEAMPGVELAGHVERSPDVSDPALCLQPDVPLVIALEPRFASARQVVLVAAPGMSRHIGQWRVEVDGRAIVGDGSSRERDTSGPWVYANAAQQLRIYGAPHRVRSAPCPHGGLAELRLLDPDAGFLEPLRPDVSTFAPPRDLGHPVERTAWVPGLALSRFRPLVEIDGRRPEEHGQSLGLSASAPIRFAPALVDVASAYDVVVTLTRTRLNPHTRIVVRDGEEILARIDPPEARDGVWQSQPVQWKPADDVANVSIELEGAGEDDSALLRDVALFERRAPIASQLESP